MQSLLFGGCMASCSNDKEAPKTDENIDIESSGLPESNTDQFDLPEIVSFNDHIRPILNKNCTACHGGVHAGNADSKMPGGLSFVYKELAYGEGKSGKVSIKPFKPEESEFFRRIITSDEDDLMPKPSHGPRLSNKEVALIRKWIEQGAEWQEHWAYQPLVSPALPQSKEGTSSHPIDLHIGEKIAEHQLELSPEADPATILRRLSFDLTGLPPAISELDAFIEGYQREPEKTFEATVQRLLSSESYGERWASVWLDLARYADSEGLGVDKKRTMWPYRDWVVAAYNNDLAYDEFTIKQLAGDLIDEPSLEDYIATGFNRNTQSNREGGTDDEEFRIAAVLDRVNTTWEVWQGQTIGCAQCHSHPYDPIEMEEYYELSAFFNNDKDADLNEHTPTIRVPYDRSQFNLTLAKYNTYLDSQEAYYGYVRDLIVKSRWDAASDAKFSSNGTKLKIVPTESGDELHTVGNVRQGSEFIQTWKPSTKYLSGIRVSILPLDIERAKTLPEVGSVLSSLTLKLNRKGQKSETVSLSYCIPDSTDSSLSAFDSLKSNSAGWGPYTKQFHPRWAVFLPAKSIDLTGVETISVSMLFKHSAGAGAVLVPKRVKLDTTGSQLFTQKSAAIQQKHSATIKAGSELKKIKGVEQPVMLTRDANLQRETNIFEKGNWLEKGKVIEKASTPKAFPGLEHTGDSANRLDMAKWLVSSDNPLSARVEANRIWQQLFGMGIVETLEDFGSTGTAPSNRRLLDHLAYKFQNDFKYSRKKLIEYIVHSEAYRRSPVASEVSREVDPRNVYLSYGSRRRLRAEAVRDMGLFSANLLTQQLYGVPTYPPIPPGVWKPFDARDKWITPKVGHPQRYRRSLYTYMKRSIPYPAFAAFDAPTREVCSKRRLVSNTPIAALTTLNDEAFSEFAKGLARIMKYETQGTLDKKLAYGYRTATSHFPDPTVLEYLVETYKAAESIYKEDPKQLKGIAGSADGGAFTVVASLILNLDATLTK